MHTVVEVPSFRKAAEDAGMSEDEILKITVLVSEDPEIGDVIPGTGGARKFRIPMKGKGKRGGGRVVTFYSGDDVPVFLLDVFSKGERITLSEKEKAAFKATMKKVVNAYREDTTLKVRQLTGTDR